MQNSQSVRVAQLPVTAYPPHICQSFCESVVVVDEVVVVATTTSTPSTLRSINDAEEQPAFDLSLPLRQTSDGALKGQSTPTRSKNDAFGNAENPNLSKRNNEKAKKPMY